MISSNDRNLPFSHTRKHFLFKLKHALRMRQENYGSPQACILNIAVRWFPTLEASEGSQKVCEHMIQLKIVRLEHSVRSNEPIQDTLIDICGYFIISLFMALRIQGVSLDKGLLNIGIGRMFLNISQECLPLVHRHLKWSIDEPQSYPFFTLLGSECHMVTQLIDDHFNYVTIKGEDQ